MRPRIAKPRNSKPDPDSYSVNWTKDGHMLKYYRDGRIVLEIEETVIVEIELSENKAKELILK